MPFYRKSPLLTSRDAFPIERATPICPYPPALGPIPPWEHVFQNFTVGNESHRWLGWSHRGIKCYKILVWKLNTTAGGIGPTVGPNITKCLCGKKSHRYSIVHAAPPAPPAPRPATTATSISRRDRRICGNPRYQLGAADLGNHTPGSLGSSVHAIHACGRNPSA